MYIHKIRSCVSTRSSSVNSGPLSRLIATPMTSLSTNEQARRMIEAGPPGVLVRRGWDRDSVRAGTEIRVEGYQARDGSNRANGRGRPASRGTRRHR